MMVGAHNTVDVTVECQVHMGGCVVFFRKGRCRYLQNTACLEACEEPHHVLPGMVNPGAYNTIDAQRHVRGFLPYGSPAAPTIL